MFFWSDSEFIVECVMPNLLHIVPIGDDSVFNWVFKGQNTPFALRFVPHIRILLSHTDHDTLMTGASHDGREDNPWGVVPRETGLAHTGSVVDDNSGHIIFSHCV